MHNWSTMKVNWLLNMTMAEQLASRFGSVSSESTPRNVCLHEEVANPDQPLLAFDVDSWMALPQSFGAFKQGFRYTPSKQVAYNIRSNLHIQRRI